MALFLEGRPVKPPELGSFRFDLVKWNASFAAMGSLLADQFVVGAVETGRVLGGTATVESGRDALAECVEDAGELRTDRSRQ